MDVLISKITIKITTILLNNVFNIISPQIYIPHPIQFLAASTDPPGQFSPLFFLYEHPPFLNHHKNQNPTHALKAAPW